MCFCLDHPGFESPSSSPETDLDSRLSRIHSVYSGYEVGDDVTLVEVGDGRVVKLRLKSLSEETCEVTLGGSGHVHVGMTSTRVVPRNRVFGGFPCVTLMPSFPLRLLKTIIAGKERRDLGMWPEKVAPENINFAVNGARVDEETGIRSMSQWAEKGEDVRVVVGSKRIPWGRRVE